MPYDPASGQWVDEDLEVSTRMTGLMSQDSPYLQQARTEGLKQANRRGLMNSSIAVGAVENERIKAVLPIASQESSQANQRYMQGRGLQSTDVTQQRDIASNETLTREGHQLQRDLQASDNTLRYNMQGRDIENQRWMANLDATTRQTMQGLDLETQNRIANMNVASADRESAATLAARFEAMYADTINSLMNNADVPAEERQIYMDHASQVRNSNFALLEQLYGIDLQWDEAA